MTSVYFHHEELNEIIQSFYNRIEHPFLKKYIDDPLVDEDQVLLLFYMLKEKNMPSTYISQCIMTTTLVQAALDTHEEISVNELIKDSHKKKRQLTVLAGDYYSSLYYFVLSKVNDITLIRVLAKSIQEINEAKMNLYNGNGENLLATFQDIKTVDSSLLQNIACLFQLPEWKEATKEFFFIKRLLKERYLWLHKGVKGSVAEILLKEAESSRDYVASDKQLITYFDHHIETAREKLFSICQEGTKISNYFHSRVHVLLNENEFDKQCVVEEG